MQLHLKNMFHTCAESFNLLTKLYFFVTKQLDPDEIASFAQLM